MTQFAIHNEHSAPEASRPVLAGVRKNLGFIPNLYGVLAEAPVAAEAYGVLTDLVTRSWARGFQPSRGNGVGAPAAVGMSKAFRVMDTNV